MQHTVEAELYAAHQAPPADDREGTATRAAREAAVDTQELLALLKFTVPAAAGADAEQGTE